MAKYHLLTTWCIEAPLEEALSGQIPNVYTDINDGLLARATTPLATTAPIQAVVIKFLHIKIQYWPIVFAIFLSSTSAFAEEPISQSAWSAVQDTISQTWQSTDYELYIPINTWHNRYFYSSSEVDGLNERPWGLGIGKSRFDEYGNWNALYAMTFMDSDRKLEPIIGYGFEKMWRPTDNFRLGAGYTVGLTMRQDMHYIPVPLILPLLSVEYKKIAVQSTYIPGGFGHVLFTWLRLQM